MSVVDVERQKAWSCFSSILHSEVGIPLCQTWWLKWIHLFSISKQKKKKKGFRLHCGSLAKMVESVNIVDINCLMTSWLLVT